MGKHFRSNGRKNFYKEEKEKSALDERTFLVEIFQKISGVEFWTEKSEKILPFENKTPLIECYYPPAYHHLQPV